MQTIRKDIRITECEYILEQCNCLTVSPHGLSSVLEATFPGTCPYLQRKALRGNVARRDDRSTPGTCEVTYSDKNIVHMFAQYSPGKPGHYHQQIVLKDGYVDDSGQRLQWFVECLESLIPEVYEGTSIAVPYRIGCGLAGGNWVEYEKLF